MVGRERREDADGALVGLASFVRGKIVELSDFPITPIA
jgi:hypothetical protein